MRLIDTKEKGGEALHKYNETHEFLEQDIKTRKKGTGTIKKSRNGKRFNAQIAINKTYFYNTFDTEEQCKEWVESLKNSVQFPVQFPLQEQVYLLTLAVHIK